MATASFYALFDRIPTDYRLALAIPVVPVGSSVQRRSRGAIRWRFPSIAVTAARFLTFFGGYAGP